MLKRMIALVCLGILVAACNPKAPPSAPASAPAAPSTTITDTAAPLAELTTESYSPYYLEKLGKLFKYNNNGDTPCYMGKVRIPANMTSDSGNVTADSGDRDRGGWCCAF